MRHFFAILLMCLPLLAYSVEQLSQKDYKLLMQAFKHIESNQPVLAYNHLSKAKTQVRNDYARALVHHNLGLLELQRDHYTRALTHLTQAHHYKKLPEDQQLNLAHTLAQLNCMEEKWQFCINYLKNWMAQRPDQVKETDQLLLAQAYSQLKKWQAVIKPVSMAIASRRVAPENWYQLKIAAHLHLKQWQAAIREQKRMLHHYADQPKHWRQLVALQLQVNDSKAALATQRIAYEHGLLRKAKDYQMLAQMMLQAQIPYYAGQVIEQGLEKGILKSNRKNLKMLSSAWLQARESRKAVTALVRLNQLSPDRQSLTQLAQMQIELQKWQSAHITIQKALKQVKNSQERLHLLLAITQIKLHHYEKAHHALVVAANDQHLKSSVDRWMRYLKQINSQSEAPGSES